MGAAATPWTKFLDGLCEARRAASEGRFLDLAVLAARLEHSAARLPAPEEREAPAIRQEFARLRGVLEHVAAAGGALSSLHAELMAAGAGGERRLDWRA